MAKGTSAHPGEAPPSALDELLDAERKIAARAAEVAVECQALVTAAHADAATISRDGEAALEREVAGLRAAAADARDAAVRAIDEQAERQARRYRSLAPAELGRFAEVIAARVTGLGGLPGDGGGP
jgi:hypothetical protein